MNFPPILTKENFWNELSVKYPLAMDKFCKWVDEYKRRVEWDVIFQKHKWHKLNDTRYTVWSESDRGEKVPAEIPEIQYRTPKFHEIPVAMQIGIFFQFVSENRLHPETEDPEKATMEGAIGQIPKWFKGMEVELRKLTK